MLSELDKEGIRVFVESNQEICAKVGPTLTIATLVAIPMDVYETKRMKQVAAAHFERIKADREEAEEYVAALLGFH